MRGIRQRKGVPYSKLGHRVNILLAEELHGLTGNIPVTVKTVRYQLKQETAYLHKIDGLSFDSGDETSGHMSSDASCLSGGVSLIQVSHRSTVTVTGLTMNTRAEPDLG